MKKEIKINELPCSCLKCYPNIFPNMRFNVCSTCGNKRCPHASDHNYKCTNSNEVGQIGSVYKVICEWCNAEKNNKNGLCLECGRFPSPKNFG